MKDLIIIGAGGLGREALVLAKSIIHANPETPWRIKGFITDIVGDFYEKNTGGVDIIGTIKDHEISNNNVYSFAIADIPFKKETTKDFLERGAQFINLIAPGVYVPPSAKLGVGNIIQYGVTLSVDIKLGNFISVNTYTTIGHDAEIKDFTTISPACAISGYTNIGEGVFLGAHAVICPHMKVGDYAHVGAGSVVVRNVKERTLVIGNPAKKLDIY